MDLCLWTIKIGAKMRILGKVGFYEQWGRDGEIRVKGGPTAAVWRRGGGTEVARQCMEVLGLVWAK
jgi:hypothetical protein